MKKLESGTFDWKEFSYEFMIPATSQGPNGLKRGFTANVSFTGPGKFYADNFILKEIH